MVNKFSYKSKIPEGKFVEIINLFAKDITAKEIAIQTGISRVSINNVINGLRVKISTYCNKQILFADLQLESEVCLSIFEQSIHDLETPNRNFLIAVFIRDEKVFSFILNDCTKEAALDRLGKHANLNCIIRYDRWRGYHKLLDNAHADYMKSIYVNGSITNISNYKPDKYWIFLKNRLTKFRGVHRSTLFHHIKECEFRYNNKDASLSDNLLLLLEQEPLNIQNKQPEYFISSMDQIKTTA